MVALPTDPKASVTVNCIVNGDGLPGLLPPVYEASVATSAPWFSHSYEYGPVPPLALPDHVQVALGRMDDGPLIDAVGAACTGVIPIASIALVI